MPGGARGDYFLRNLMGHKLSDALLALAAKVVLRHDPFAHRFPSQQMLLQDALESRRRDVPIPNALGIDHEPRSSGANAEAARLRAHHAQSGFLHAFFYKVPQHFALARMAAIGAEAEEEMPLSAGDARLGEAFVERTHALRR